MSMYTVYSPDDGGWYTEVFSWVTGEELFRTDLYATKAEARQAGLSWCKAHPF